MRQIWVNQKGLRHSATVERDELASQSTCSNHTDLLAQDSPYRNLETIPTTGSPQPRPLCHQGSKHRIAGQMIVDRLDVSSKIEQASYSGNDRRQQPNVRKADADTKALSIGQVSHLYASHRPIHLNRAQVASILYNFNARNRTRSQEAEHRVPVVGRTIAKPKRDVFLFVPHGVLSTQSAGRTME